jgi:hypothetical protein
MGSDRDGGQMGGSDGSSAAGKQWAAMPGAMESHFVLLTTMLLTDCYFALFLNPAIRFDVAAPFTPKLRG